MAARDWHKEFADKIGFTGKSLENILMLMNMADEYGYASCMNDTLKAIEPLHANSSERTSAIADEMDALLKLERGGVT